MNNKGLCFFVPLFLLMSFSSLSKGEDNQSFRDYLYFDTGKVYGDYIIEYKPEERKSGKTEYYMSNMDNIDFSAGINYPFHVRSFPVFFNLRLSNLIEGLSNKNKVFDLPGWLAADGEMCTPGIHFSLGSFNKTSLGSFFWDVFYSGNIRGDNTIREYGMTGSLSIALRKKLSASVTCGIMRRHIDIASIYKYREYPIFGELTVSCKWKYFIPYLSYYDEMFSVMPGADFSKKDGGLTKVGIQISLNGGHNGTVGRPHNYPLNYFKYWVSRIGVKKPNIYLYPENDTEISVNLESHNGSYITESIPEYGQGWNVSVKKDGTIEEKYGYLFYEGDIEKPVNLTSGWCVPKEQVMTFFSSVLKSYRFNEREIKDFIDYWSVNIPNGRYYKIYPLLDSQIDTYFKLNISPHPDSVRRLWLYVMPADREESLPQPYIKPFSRNGFTVTEWGVIVK